MSAVGSPWYERRPRRVAGVLVVLFAAVLAARWLPGSGPHAVTALYVFPVALMALTWGLRGGIAGAILATALMVVSEVIGRGTLEALGWVSQVSAVALLGVLLGAAQDRTRAHRCQELARRDAEAALEREVERSTASAEISDSLIQGMVGAKWMLELGRPDEATVMLEETIERAQRVVSGMLGPRVVMTPMDEADRTP
jgi:glucose-6-phosphate-specific signal transduction histidine kinase